MTTHEALTDLFSKYKYAELGHKLGLPESTIKSYAKRFKEGTLRVETQEDILTKAGYLVKREKEWKIK